MVYVLASPLAYLEPLTEAAMADKMCSSYGCRYWTRVRGFPLNERFWSIDRPLGRADLDDIVLNHLSITYASYEVPLAESSPSDMSKCSGGGLRYGHLGTGRFLVMVGHS